MPASLSTFTISGQISWWRRTYSSSYPGLTSKTHAYCAICPLSSFRVRRTRDRAGARPCAACPRGGLRRGRSGASALLAPGVHERGGRQREPETAVGVPDPQRRSGQRLPLGSEHLELPFAGLRYGEDRDGPCLDAELHGDAVARLPVVDPQAPQHRLAVAYGDVPGAVVAHEDKALVEVHRVELRERLARPEGVPHLHGDGVLQVVLPGGRDTARGEQGVAQYETGAEPLVEAAVRPPVVGKGVQV